MLSDRCITHHWSGQFWLSRTSREKREEYDLEDPIDSDLSLPITPSVEETTVDPEEPQFFDILALSRRRSFAAQFRRYTNSDAPVKVVCF